MTADREGQVSSFEMQFTVASVDTDVLARYFGQPPQPACSVVIDRVEWVSGQPPRPQPRRGWRRAWDWATRRHQHALHLHAIREAAWVEAGCPDVPMTVRTYIPRAHLTAAEPEPSPRPGVQREGAGGE